MRNLERITLVLIGAFLLYSVIYAQRKDDKTSKTVPDTVQKAAAQITAARLKEDLNFIASDELEGRDTPSRGLDIAAMFIANKLSHWGLKPAGDKGTYFQRFGIVRTKTDVARTYAEIDGLRFSAGYDFLAPRANASVSGQLVYVGHGWIIKSKNINAYEGVDVKDKIVIFSQAREGGFPKGISASDLTGKRGVDYDYPLDTVMKLGAKGIIRLPNLNTLTRWKTRRAYLLEGDGITLDQLENQVGTQFPEITASLPMMASLFKGEQHSAEELFRRGVDNDQVKSFELNPNKKASFTVSATSEKLSTQNVVAVVEGSDPVLKNEYVNIGAHYDANVEIGITANGDSVYNGADDNGSGTVALLAMAEAFARGPRPKRSILFIWDAGDENGGLGSRYFTQFPTVPLNRIVTHIDVDMIGRSRNENDTNPENKELTGPNEVYVSGPKTMSTGLYEIVEAVNQSYLNLTYNYSQDTLLNTLHGDSGHFGRKGLLILTFFTGGHEDYHELSDSADKIDYQKMEKITRTIFATAWAIANAADRLQIDKPLPPEMMNRK